MAVPSSGTLSLAGIRAELATNTYNASATTQSSLLQCSNGTVATINTANASSDRPDGSAPHSMAEFYAYDHDLSSFANSFAVSKSLTTGEANAITFTDTDGTFNFTGTSAWSISFWVKAGWTSSLNTNIHFIIGQLANPTYQMEDMIKIIYAENTNRIEVRYGNKTAEAQWYNQGGWLFHANSGSYAPGFSAAGLGTTFWSSSNRGNVNSDDYTMITVTKSTTNAASAMKLYWNQNGMGAAPIQTNNNSANRTEIPMDSEANRIWSLGSNGDANSQIKTGNGEATVYNDLTIWNKQLSDSEVTELYNGGTVMDAYEAHSATENLIGYWKWEGNGDATVSNDNFTISGDSAIVSK